MPVPHGSGVQNYVRSILVAHYKNMQMRRVEEMLDKIGATMVTLLDNLCWSLFLP